MPKKATLCFVKHRDKILMINRNKPPFMGLWNALGGHVEEGETTEQCAKREIYEESGICVDVVRLISVFTWNYDDEIGYAYLTELPEDFDESTYPVALKEGIIAFKEIDWILSEKNYGVIEDLRVFLADIKSGEYKNYHLIYKENKLERYEIKS